MSLTLAFIPGGTEWILICLVLLLLFGAKKLPEAARGIGRSLGEFRKAREEFDEEKKNKSSTSAAPETPESGGEDSK
ncbi:MAG: twin-arginine translocase TatA/TatE family subunit [Verrucomicrobiales bacterium]